MKNFYFSARNVEDYITAIRDEISATEDFLDKPEVQKHLHKICKIYAGYEKFLSMPINFLTCDNIKLDFNLGLRLEIPAGNFRVKISDVDSEMIFLDREISNVRLISVEKYYIHWRVEIFRDGEKIFEHTLDLNEKPVQIYIPKIGLGDTISMLPYIEEFRRRHNCKIFLHIPEYLREFAKNLYPNFYQTNDVDSNYYAMYYIFVPITRAPTWYVDVRNYPMWRIGGVMLGLKKIASKKIFEPTMPPALDEPYVCIAAQASNSAKCWLYPNGWEIIVDYLKSLGYRVLCIDKLREVESYGVKISMPKNAEDFTGNRPIMERANMLYYAEFFIGLGSGLSWLADAVDCPVVMICNFSQDWLEFYTPYRVMNRLVCNGCFNDVRINYVSLKCPYHEGTPRELECQKKISPRQVIESIERLIIDKNLKPPIFL